MLPNELIVEIFSLLSVKPLMRFRCVNKFFNTLVYDPYFIQMHLKRSKRNLHLAAMPLPYSTSSVMTFPNIYRLLEQQENSSTTIQYDPYHRLIEKNDRLWWVAGSCNGLICLIDRGILGLCLWNPTTRTKSQIFYVHTRYVKSSFTFVYDVSTQTYKVVELRIEGEHGSAMVQVFSFRDYSSRYIQCFLPLFKFNSGNNTGVYLSGTINWLVLRDYVSSRGNFVYQPELVVLRDTLNFFHDFEETHFVIWQMKDFGVQQQLFKINSNKLPSCYYNYGTGFKQLGSLPLYLSKIGDTLVLANHEDGKAFIYNRVDNKVEEIGITNKIIWSHARDYVESLVPTH
ncbi:putative F-box domain-containing protein [Medicago truncatula]|uniref:Putative F-box domain-containing protein n=1 Tax=Medicago truncatula TaxID=3880 RepID=A0A396GQY6_MEDTR|nr:putative F-box domain-containing protein [Medicago truncatula]